MAAPDIYQLAASGLASVVSVLAGFIARSAAASAHRFEKRLDVAERDISTVKSDLAYLEGRIDGRVPPDAWR